VAVGLLFGSFPVQVGTSAIDFGHFDGSGNYVGLGEQESRGSPAVPTFGFGNGSDVNRFVIQNSTGNVGIGTAAPFLKLSINGGLHVGGDSDAGDNNILADGTITSTGLLTASAGLTLSSGTLTLTGDTVAGTPTWSSNQAITLSTAAQPNITSVGTLSGLTVTAAPTFSAMTLGSVLLLAQPE